MSANASSSVSVARAAPAVTPRYRDKSPGRRSVVMRLSSLLHHFLEGLADRHDDIDLEVVKRVPTPV